MSHDTIVEPAIEVDLAFRTDPGRDPEKQVNEDSGFHMVTRFGTLCVVCDGMGGHANGQDASQAAVQAIRETFDAAPEGSLGRDLLVKGITLGHDRIRALPLASGEGRSGSTVVAVLITPHGAEIAHVGDSRVYHVARGTVQQVTRDHSMVQLMVEAGMLKPEEAATHPDANKIMRALGIAATVEVDLRPAPIPFGPGDIFVLASDGLTDLVTEAEILSLTAQPGEQAVGQLVDLANARGGHDNITVLLARPREGSHAPTGPHAPIKTVPVTAVDPQDVGRVSPQTVLAAPLPLPAPASPQTALGPPLQLSPPVPPPAPGSGSQLPLVPAAPAPIAPERTARRSSRGLGMVLGGIALVALVGGAVALYKLLEKPKHHEPTIVTPLSALPTGGEDAGAPEPPPTAEAPPPETPPLDPGTAPKPAHAHHGHKPHGTATPTAVAHPPRPTATIPPK